MYLWKMVNIFHKDYSKKLAAASVPFNSILSITKPIVKLYKAENKMPNKKHYKMCQIKQQERYPSQYDFQ